MENTPYPAHVGTKRQIVEHGNPVFGKKIGKEAKVGKLHDDHIMTWLWRVCVPVTLVPHNYARVSHLKRHGVAQPSGMFLRVGFLIVHNSCSSGGARCRVM